MEDIKEIMDVPQAAEYLGLDKETVYRRLQSGKLPGIKIGSLWRLKKSELDKMFQTGAHSEKA